MSGPLQRIGQVVGQSIRRLGPPPQPVYRERLGKAPETASTGPINRPSPAEQRRLFYRVGFNPKQKGRVDAKTGERFLTGTYPTKAGVEGALRSVPDGRTEVRVYGEPAWDTRKRTSPPPDALGNTYVTFFTSKADLEAALAGPGTMEDVVAQTGSYDFKQVLTVWVGEA
jgi:hypothetical protein